MKEKELKHLFISSIKSNHIQNNKILPFSPSIDKEIRIKDEGYFRNFDLVIAIIQKRNKCNVNFESLEVHDAFYNIFMRAGLLTDFAKKEKCRIDWIRFYPVELKSDEDIIDGRLANQILNAIMTFGRSIIVLDQNHTRKADLKRMLAPIPATIIGYTGKGDHFQILSSFDKFVVNGIFSIAKRSFFKTLIDNGLNINNDKIYRCLVNLQRINQKLAFSQLYNENIGFEEEEIEFIRGLVELRSFSYKKYIANQITKTKNNKITDYI